MPLSLLDQSPIFNPFVRDNSADTFRCCYKQVAMIVAILKEHPEPTPKLRSAIRKLNQIKLEIEPLIGSLLPLAPHELNSVDEQVSHLLSVAELLQYRSDCIKHAHNINYIALALGCVFEASKTFIH